MTGPGRPDHPVPGERPLVDQLAALRRLGELVARGVDRPAVFDAIVAEAYAAFHVDFTALLRYEPDGAAHIVALHHGPPGLEIGERAPHLPGGLVLRVFHSGRPIRIAYADVPHDEAARLHELGITAGVAAPILVEGHLWGVLTGMSITGAVAAGLEYRIADFADIAATAVAGAHAKDDFRSLEDEQGALRRVAELAARGTEPVEVFRALAVEVSALRDGCRTAITRFDPGDSATVIAAVGDHLRVGRRMHLTGNNLGAVVRRSGQAARLDDRSASSAGVGVPINVAGEVWGMLAVSPGHRRLPPDTERCLSQFAEIAAIAMLSAQSRADLRRLAAEQAALRRAAELVARQQAALRQVAELAATNASAEQVLEAVAVQACYLADVSFTTVLRYEPDGSTEIMALSGAPGNLVPGMRAPGTGDGAVQRVWRTGRSARIDDLAGLSGRWPQVAHGFGFATSAAVPIRIQGRLWGVLVAVGRDQPISADVQDDLTGFAELAGTAISAAQARDEVRALAEEQAAFRRVAELVAHGTALDELFDAITTEASKLLGGAPTALRPGDTGPAAGRLAVPVTVEGRVWGTLTAHVDQPLSPGAEERLHQFAELAALAIANAENKAQLTASRARVVATADETRRRLQRDVHDGAQQRLVQAIITLKLARDSLAKGRAVDVQIDEALYHAERANHDLRDVVHGILPAALTQGGLRTGLESLLNDLSLPVRLRLDTPLLPTETETTAYFIVAEALTNVVKHARAEHAEVTVRLDGGTLSIEVRDDGVGGADPARGTGLTGLSDRVGAAGGVLGLVSTGQGTAVRASLPVRTPPSA